MMKNIFGGKFSKVVTFLAVGAAVFVALLIAYTGSNAEAVSCGNPATTATLNPFPITYTGEPCKDYPMVSARLVDGGYPQNASEHNAGIFVNPGEEAYVSVYVHNGAAENLDPNQTTAKNVWVFASVDGSIGSEHTVSASARGDNTNEIGGSFRIRTGANDRLVYVPGSAELLDAGGGVIASGFDAGAYRIGDMLACFDHVVYVRFKVRAEGDGATSSGRVFRDGDINRIPNACLFNSRVTWTTQNVQEAKVLVRDPETFEEKVFGIGTTGTGETPWLKPNLSYRFALWNTSNGQETKLDDFWLEVGDLYCPTATSTPTPTPTFVPSPTPTPVLTPTPTPVRTPTPTPIFTTTPMPVVVSNPVCDLNWYWPYNVNQFGLRKIGGASDVQIILTGFAPDSTVVIKNTNLDNGGTRSAPVTVDASGSFNIRDMTTIRSDEYSIGTY
ncbi:MAG: hypothetical protein Q7S32_00560, partial [bacterium]|nr:hypothetical protein [bacterium]